MSQSTAIVTGASQGIGRATAIRLSKDFKAVVLVARNREHLLETAASVGMVLSIGLLAFNMIWSLRHAASIEDRRQRMLCIHDSTYGVHPPLTEKLLLAGPCLLKLQDKLDLRRVGGVRLNATDSKCEFVILHYAAAMSHGPV